MDASLTSNGPLPPLATILSRPSLAYDAPVPSVQSYKPSVSSDAHQGSLLETQNSAYEPEARKKRRDRPPASDMKANMRRSKHRDKEKREIMFLRACSHALQQELAQLERDRRERSSNSKGSGAVDRERRAWYALAMIRKGERECSEAENVKLKAIWRMQLQFAAQMQGLDGVPRSVSASRAPRLTIGAADAAVFQSLFEDVDTTYRQMCKFLEITGLSQLPEEPYLSISEPTTSAIGASPPFIQAYQPPEIPRSSTAPTRCLNLVEVDCQQSSFSFFHANVLKMTESFIIHRGNSARYDINCENEGILAMKKQEKSSHGGIHEAVDMFTVWKRYMISPDCEVIVWRSLNVGCGGLYGLSSIETSFVHFTRSQTNPDSTTVRRMRRLEAMTQSGASQTRARSWELLERFNALCMNAIEQDTKKLVQDLDHQGISGLSLQV